MKKKRFHKYFVGEKIQKKKLKRNFNRRIKHCLVGWLRDKFDPQTSIPRSVHPFPIKETGERNQI